MNELETWWKLFYNSVEDGLNCGYWDTGGGLKSEETKRKIGESNKGRICVWKNKKRPEHALIMKEKGFKYIRTKEHRSYLSKIQTGKKFSKETCLKISQAKKGKGLKSITCPTLFNIKFNSIIEAEKILGIRAGDICDVLKGRKTHVLGLVFEYV